MPETKCLVCDEVIRAGSGKDIFQKGMLGLRPLKERLQVVLQVNLDRRSSHSSRLCLTCFKQLAVIDKYQCNIEAFSDTFQDAAETREAESSDSENADGKGIQCFTCNTDISSAHNAGTENPDGKSLKTRLERVLSVNLEKEMSLLGCVKLCLLCMDTLGTLEDELEAVTDFSSRYRTTRGLYKDDDIDDDLAGMMDDDEEEEEVEEEDEWAEFDRSFKMSKLLRIAHAKQAMNSADIVVDYEGIEAAEKDIVKIGRSDYKCGICNETRSALGPMRNHILMHADVKPFSCKKCGKSFLERGNCNKHLGKCELAGSVAVEPVANAPIRRYKTIIRESGKKEFECLLCDKVTDTMLGMNGHMSVHKGCTLSSTESSASDSGFSSRGNTRDSVSPSVAPSQADVELMDCDWKGASTAERYNLNLKCQSDKLVKRNKQTRQYVCTECGYNSSVLQPCIEHARVHTGERPFACNLCDKAFANSSNYYRHQKTQHTTSPGVQPREQQTSESIFLDSSQPIVLDSSSSEDSMEAVPETMKPFHCSFCPDSFHDPALLTEHIRRHMEEVPLQGDVPHMLSSPVSGMWPNQSNQAHLNSASGLVSSDGPRSTHSSFFPPNYSQHADSMTETRNSTNECSVSGSLYQAEQSMPRDFPLVIRKFDDGDMVYNSDSMIPAYSPDDITHLAEQFDQDFDPTAVSQEVRDALILYDAENKIYKCVACTYQNKQQGRIKQHIRYHTGEKPFKCRYCPQRYADTTNVRRHEQKLHSMELDKSYEDLNRSLIRYDAESGMHKCLACTYTHRQMTELMQHIRVHTGEKPYKCGYCQNRFTDPSNRRRHEHKMHSADKLEQEEQQETSHTFSQLETTHKFPQQETTHTLPQQDTTHTLPQQDTTHTLPQQETTHRFSAQEQTNINAYIQYDGPNAVHRCLACPYKHSRLGELIRHIRMHTGEKPFKCRFCSSYFSDSSNCRKHELKHHGNEATLKLPATRDAEPRARTVKESKPFQCDVCQVSFRYESTLRRHRQLHSDAPASTSVSDTTPTELRRKLSPGQGFHCAVCGVVFTLAMDLMRHYKSEHSLHPQLFQLLQDLQTNIQQLEQHPSIVNNPPQTQSDINSVGNHTMGSEVHSDKKAFESTIEQIATGEYQCILCCKAQSYNLDDILRHQADNHSQMEVANYKDMINSGRISIIVQAGQEFCCKICPVRTFTLTEIHTHIEQFHFVKLKRTIPIEDAKSTISVEDAKHDSSLIMKKDPKSTFYLCLFCPVRHKAPKMLAKHVKFKHSDKFINAKISIKTEPTCPPTENDPPKKNVCKRRSNLPYVCAMCPHKFEEPGDLQVHFGEHVPGHVYPFTSTLRFQAWGLGAANFYACTLCGATYVSQKNLDRHVENHAVNAIPLNNTFMKPNTAAGTFTCPLCSAIFLGYPQLIDHIELHNSAGSVNMGQDQPVDPSVPQPHLTSLLSLQNPSNSSMDQVDSSMTVSIRPSYKSRIDEVINSVLFNNEPIPGEKHPLEPDEPEIANKRQRSTSIDRKMDTVVKIKTEPITISPVECYTGDTRPSAMVKSLGLTNEQKIPSLPTLRAALQKPCQLSSDSVITNSHTDLGLQDSVPKRNVTSGNEEQETLPDGESDTLTCESDQRDPLSTPDDWMPNMLDVRSLNQEEAHVHAPAIKLEHIEQVAYNTTQNVQNMRISQVVSGDSAVPIVQREDGAMDSQGENPPLGQPSNRKVHTDKLELLKIENMTKYFQKLDHPKKNNEKMETSVITEVDSVLNLEEAVKPATTENMVERIEGEKGATILDRVLENESASGTQINTSPVSEHVGASVIQEELCPTDKPDEIVTHKTTQYNNISDVSDNELEEEEHIAAKKADVSEISSGDDREDDDVSDTAGQHSECDTGSLGPDVAALHSVSPSCVAVNGAHSDTSTPNLDCKRSEKNFTILDSHVDRDEPHTSYLNDVQDTGEMGSNQEVHTANRNYVQSEGLELSVNTSGSEVTVPMAITDMTNDLPITSKEITGDGTAEIDHDSGDIRSSITKDPAVPAEVTSPEPQPLPVVTSTSCITHTLTPPLSTVTTTPLITTTNLQPCAIMTATPLITTTESQPFSAVSLAECIPSTDPTEDESLSSQAIEDCENGVTKALPVDIVCSLCLKEFDTKLSFLQHLKTHVGVKCPLCILTFNDISEMYKHVDELH